MKIIKTNNYLKFADRGTDLNTFPNVTPTDIGPSKTVLREDETEEDIKKRWKKKKNNNPAALVYQTGVAVPKPEVLPRQ